MPKLVLEAWSQRTCSLVRNMERNERRLSFFMFSTISSMDELDPPIKTLVLKHGWFRRRDVGKFIRETAEQKWRREVSQIKKVVAQPSDPAIGGFKIYNKGCLVLGFDAFDSQNVVHMIKACSDGYNIKHVVMINSFANIEIHLNIEGGKMEDLIKRVNLAHDGNPANVAYDHPTDIDASVSFHPGLSICDTSVLYVEAKARVGLLPDVLAFQMQSDIGPPIHFVATVSEENGEFRAVMKFHYYIGYDVEPRVFEIAKQNLQVIIRGENPWPVEN